MPFEAVTATLGMYVQLLDQLIAYGSMDAARAQKSFLAKRLHMKLQQLEMCMSTFGQRAGVFGAKNTRDVLQRLRSVYHVDVHPWLAAMLLSKEMVHLTRWLRHVVYDGRDGHRSKDSKRVFLRDESELNDVNQLRLEAFVVLAYLSEEANETLAFGIIEEFGFNLRNNTDLLIVVRLLGLLMAEGRKTSVRKADWCFGQVKLFCQYYYSDQRLTEVLVDLIPGELGELMWGISQYFPCFRFLSLNTTRKKMFSSVT